VTRRPATTDDAYDFTVLHWTALHCTVVLPKIQTILGFFCATGRPAVADDAYGSTVLYCTSLYCTVVLPKVQAILGFPERPTKNLVTTNDAYDLTVLRCTALCCTVVLPKIQAIVGFFQRRGAWRRPTTRTTLLYCAGLRCAVLLCYTGFKRFWVSLSDKTPRDDGRFV